MEYNNKQHANPIKGGRTDVKLKYFNIEEKYFQKKCIEKCFTLPKRALAEHFNLKKFMD
jgi:hypothetical protein